MFPLLTSEWVGLVLITVFMSLANAGGLSGGPIFVPLAMATYGFTIREAIPLVSVSAFMGSLVRYVFYSVNKKHPLKDATLIDYSIASILFPSALVGNILGVFVNITLPLIVLVTIMSILFVILTTFSYRKAIKMYMKETAEKEGNSTTPVSSQVTDVDVKSEQGTSESLLSAEHEKQELAEILEREKTDWGQRRVYYNFAVIVVLAIIVSFIRGSSKTPSVIGI